MNYAESVYLDLDRTAAGLVIVDLGVGEISSGMGGIVEPCVMIVLLHGLDAALEDIVVTWG